MGMGQSIAIISISPLNRRETDRLHAFPDSNLLKYSSLNEPEGYFAPTNIVI
jgi:hypothetical protein